MPVTKNEGMAESWYASGALASMSKRRPAPVMEGADYSFYDRFHGGDGTSEGIDLSLLLADLRFSSVAEPELELVDIVVNATRRALIGNLGEAGWGRFPTLMIHRREPYIQFMMLTEGSDQVRHPAYGRLVNQFFSHGGRPMVAPRFLRSIAAEGEGYKALRRREAIASHRAVVHAQ